MFIAKYTEKSSSAPLGAQCGYEYLAPLERSSSFGLLFYKHLVPPGRKPATAYVTNHWETTLRENVESKIK
jgi:hypothetical protein